MNKLTDYITSCKEREAELKRSKQITLFDIEGEDDD